MQICLIAGDGIGGEVLAVAGAVLQTLVPAITLVQGAAGWQTFQETGTALPDATLVLAQQSDAVLFGASGSPSYPVPGYRSPIVALRKALDVYANIRPTRNLPAAVPVVDLVVVRENTEGLYAGRERTEDAGDTVITERVITRRASERIARAAAELARQRASTREAGRARVTVVHKANVIREGDGLFRRVALEVLAGYPELDAEEMLADVAAMRLAQSPERFDVVVTTNMFGDILSDVACIHGGGLGLASSASIGDAAALFEPVHGSAPDIAGKGIANPLAALECAAMLLDWLAARHNDTSYTTAAARLRQALAAVLRDGPHTPDLGGTATTPDVRDRVIELVS